MSLSKAENNSQEWATSRLLSSMMSLWVAGCGVLVGNPEKPKTGSGVQGAVVLGSVSGATVKIFALNADGTRGELLATTTTDADGNYSADIEADGPVSVLATGGSYVDEATESKVSNNVELETFIDTVEDDSFVGVNALTTVAAANAKRNAAAGLENAIRAANGNVAAIFGVSGVDIVGTRPDDVTIEGQILDGTSSSTRLGFAMAGMSRLTLDSGLAPGQVGSLVKSIAEDYADGGFDGLNDGSPLSTALGVTPHAAMTGLGEAIKNFAGSPQNRSGIPAGGVAISVPTPPKAPTNRPGGKPTTP